MNNIKKVIAAAAVFAFTSFSFAQSAAETPGLSVSIGAGVLEIEEMDSTVFNPSSGTFTSTLSAQTDAVNFLVAGIAINDLNGDGSGWDLQATPSALVRTGGYTGSSTDLTVGTTVGFDLTTASGSGSEADSTVSVNQLQCSRAEGTDDYTITYEINYTIPASVEAGTYTGTVALVLAAL